MDPTGKATAGKPGKPCKGRAAARVLAKIRRDPALVAHMSSTLLLAVDVALAPFAGDLDVMGFGWEGGGHGM